MQKLTQTYALTLIYSLYFSIVIFLKIGTFNIAQFKSWLTGSMRPTIAKVLQLFSPSKPVICSQFWGMGPGLSLGWEKLGCLTYVVKSLLVIFWNNYKFEKWFQYEFNKVQLGKLDGNGLNVKINLKLYMETFNWDFLGPIRVKTILFFLLGIGPFT